MKKDRRWQDWPLSAAELARRKAEAEFAAANPDAADPDCPICQAMRGPCAAHLALRRCPELRATQEAAAARAAAWLEASTGCEHCEGRGQVALPSGRWEACPRCNPSPPYPVIGPLAAAAMPDGARYRGRPAEIAAMKAGADAAARGFWANYNRAHGIMIQPPRPVPAVARSEASRNAPGLGPEYFAAKERSDLLWAGFRKLNDKAAEDAYVRKYWRTDEPLPEWVVSGGDPPPDDDLFE